MPQGTCKLCLEYKELSDSHYLPKRLYAFGRARQMKNPNPLVVSDKSAKQVSDQLRGHVFCKGCEELFNKNGEAWVLAKIPHDYGEPFPLQDALAPEKPLAIGRDVNLYDGSSIKAFDMEKLVYFGLSIFWRGAAHNWKSTFGLSAPKVDLEDYFEPLRLFLRKQSPIPRIWCYRSTSDRTKGLPGGIPCLSSAYGGLAALLVLCSGNLLHASIRKECAGKCPAKVSSRGEEDH